MTVWIALTAAALTGVLVAEYRGVRWGVWMGKPLASAGFICAAWFAGATSTPYGQWILAGLVLSWLGDVFLIPKGKAPFLVGTVAFLLAHVAYGVAFVTWGTDFIWAAAAGAGLLVPAVWIGRWLLPNIDAGLRPAIIAYIVVITSMVALAVGVAPTAGGALLLAAAVCFYISDLSVALDRFVSPSFVNRLWGLPLYYAAQLAFAASVS